MKNLNIKTWWDPRLGVLRIDFGNRRWPFGNYPEGHNKSSLQETLQFSDYFITKKETQYLLDHYDEFMEIFHQEKLKASL